MTDPQSAEQSFIADALSNPYNRSILDRWHRLELKDGWLVAGCLFQTVWNLQAGKTPADSIRDYDIFYFDDTDLSAEGEARVQRRIDRELGSLGIAIEAKNQARVHLWYEEFFGFAYPKLTSSRDGIDRFLMPSTCVGMRKASSGYELYAPHGVELVYAGVLAPNPLTPHLTLFREKAKSYSRRWNWLEVREG